MIGKDGTARAVAGLDSTLIRGDIRNIVQLIVVDDSGNIAAFDEVRREKESDTEAVLAINSITFGQTYHFLLLMGHWERNYAAETGGNYAYTSDPPTLMAAGLKADHLVTGSGKITVVMWPLVVDTKFTTNDSDVPIALRTAEPGTDNGKPEKASLLPVGWNVVWTIRRGINGNGLSELVRAQKKTNRDAGDLLLLKSGETIAKGTGKTTPAVSILNSRNELASNEITLDIESYTSGPGRIQTTGSASFKLKYVPFNLTGAAWGGFNGDSVFTLSGNNAPVWIIRNGINDQAQNDQTDFTSLGNGSANGNGAVSFVVTAGNPGDGDNPNPNGEYLLIRDGAFKGPASSKKPDISFTTEGYTGNGTVYYAVVDAGAPAPAYSAYTGNLGSLPAGKGHRKPITVSAANGDYDIYVIVVKGGAVSVPLIINTKTGIDWIWEDGLYVASYGDNGNPGTKEEPLGTVQGALDKLTAMYAGTEAPWPGKGTSDEADGKIVILDTVTVTSQINVNGGTGYPAIVLRDDPGTPGGKLQAAASIGGSRAIVDIRGGAKVTLAGNLVLRGTGNSAHNIKGVNVDGDGATFTMTGGEISGNSTSSSGNVYGSGVYVRGTNAAFIMKGGKIRDNTVTSSSATAHGGGVAMDSNGAFTMSGGEISGNTVASTGNSTFCAAYGGGVWAYKNCTVTITGGKISGNTITTTSKKTAGSYSMGGGVFMDTDCTFTMSDGEISGNTVSATDNAQGGGVSGENLSTFTISGNAKISGNMVQGSYTQGGGVLVGGGNFSKTGNSIIYGYTGDTSGNTVKNLSGAIVNKRGHAAYYGVSNNRKGDKYRDSTAGSGINLYAEESTGLYTGWDGTL
jgi:hypothetical protein